MALSCGSCKAYCCRIAGLILKELDRGDGICLYLNKNNKCEIYDHRPIICNTDKMYDKYFKDKYTKEEWIELNKRSCKDLENESKQSEVEDKVQKFEEMEGIQRQDSSQAESRPNNGSEVNKICESSPHDINR